MCVSVQIVFHVDLIKNGPIAKCDRPNIRKVSWTHKRIQTNTKNKAGVNRAVAANKVVAANRAAANKVVAAKRVVADRAAANRVAASKADDRTDSAVRNKKTAGDNSRRFLSLILEPGKAVKLAARLRPLAPAHALERNTSGHVAMRDHLRAT